MTRLLATAAVLALLAPALARADRRVVIGPDAKTVQLTTSFERRGSARLFVAGRKPVTLHTGLAAATVVAGHDKVVVALAVDAAKQPFRVIVIEGGKRGEPIAIARPAGRRDLPFAVVATPTPTGFAVFFQEVEQADPSAAHTYLVELDEAGQPTGTAKPLAVPWSLAAAVHNGKGYHLALIYPGDASGMRLSMVSLGADGRPEQHPDWASPAGWISDVHLVADDARIRAIYRGGKAGKRMLESDVTAIRGWGSEPPKPTDLGALSGQQAIAIAEGRPIKTATR